MCVFYDQTCTIQTLTDCLVAEDQCGLNVANEHHGQYYRKHSKPDKDTLSPTPLVLFFCFVLVAVL